MTKHSVLVEHGSLFGGKVPTPMYHAFLSKDKCITPDIFIPHFHNIQDWAADVKIFNVHGDYSNYVPTYGELTSKTPRMVDHRGPNDCTSSYNRKAVALDIDIAKIPKSSTGPFLKALHSLHGGHITPLVGGAFGECSSAIDTLLKDCALQVAASEAGLLLSPDIDTSSLSSTRNLLLHEFRQVVGCTVLRANVDCKLQRLAFIRSTIKDAKAVIHRTKKVNTIGSSFDFHRWFQNVGDGGVYDTFYRFVNQGHFSRGFSLHSGSPDSINLI